jgi:poly(A) polymerase
VRDNVWGSEEEDARRRDFTINALMYDPESETIRDSCRRLPGSAGSAPAPDRRSGHALSRRPGAVAACDPFHGQARPEARAGNGRSGGGHGARCCTTFRRRACSTKSSSLFLGGHAWPTYQALVRKALWEPLFPALFDDPTDPPVLVEQALKNTDDRIAEGKPVTPAFLFAAFLWNASSSAPRADQGRAGAGRSPWRRPARKPLSRRQNVSPFTAAFRPSPRKSGACSRAFANAGKRALRLMSTKGVSEPPTTSCCCARS